MEKIILKDNTQIEIGEGTSINAVTVTCEGFASLDAICTALTKAGNLDAIKITSNETVTAVYEGLKLTRPVFTAVDVVNENVKATFALAEKSEIEKRMDLLEHSQAVQDGALLDIGDVVSELSEGGGA